MEKEKYDDENLDDYDDEDDVIEWGPFDENNEIVEKIEPYRRSSPKIGRNEPCPCGSGKKFKKCHGA